MDCNEREQLQQAMTRLADGDRAAFVPVYEALWPVLRRFVERSLGNPCDADDVAQEALLKVFARASEFDPNREALPWTLGIASYECRTLRRRISRRREDHAAWELEAARQEGPSPEDDVIGRDLEAAALEALGTLRTRDAETILVATGGGARPPIPGATFRKRLERAVGRLRIAWRARHGSE